MKAGGRMKTVTRILIGGLILGFPVTAPAQRPLLDGQLKQGVLSFDGRATMGHPHLSPEETP